MSRRAIPGRYLEKCESCGHTWWDWTRDLGSPSIVDCPECGDTETETLETVVDKEEK